MTFLIWFLAAAISATIYLAGVSIEKVAREAQHAVELGEME